MAEVQPLAVEHLTSVEQRFQSIRVGSHPGPQCAELARPVRATRPRPAGRAQDPILQPHHDVGAVELLLDRDSGTQQFVHVLLRGSEVVGGPTPWNQVWDP